MKKSVIVVIAFLSTLLAGCAAPVVVSNVTVFQSINDSDLDKTYRIEAAPEQINNLEFSSYAGLLNNALQRIGFVATDKNPMLNVKMNYSSSSRIVSSWEPSPFPLYRPYGVWGWPSYGSDWQSVVDTVYTHQLEVTIGCVADGKSIYSVRARLNSANPELSTSMGYLIESAFQRFPGKNGVTERVEVPLR